MIIKLAITAVIFAVIIVYLKSINGELAVLATVAASAVIVCFGLDMLADVFSLYERIAEMSGVGENVLKIVIKVTLVAYIVEFSAGLIEDFGMKSLADKLVFVGKVLIILLAVPILESLVHLIEGLI